MRKSRGCELPGTFNPLIVGDLFFQQSLPWKSVVDEYCEKILESTRLCVDLSLIHITDDRTRAGLHREIIDPALEKFSKALSEEVSELMRPYQKGHPITYNHYFIETVQKAREEHDRNELQRGMNAFFKLSPKTTGTLLSQKSFNTADLLNALTKSTEQDMELYACSEATYCMEAYYKVAMKVVVDNVAILGIEFCLLEKLSDMLSSDVVMSLKDDVVQEIAAEQPDSQIERARALTKLQSLEAGLQTLQRLGRHKLGVHDFDSTSETYEDEVEKLQIEESIGEREDAIILEEDDPSAPVIPAEDFANLSPFNAGGTIREDSSWLNSSPRTASAKKKSRTNHWG